MSELQPNLRAKHAKDPLLSSLAIGKLLLKNRIMVTAHEPNYNDRGLPSDRSRRYVVERAKGGVALCFVAGSAVVSQDSSPAHGNLQAYRDEIVAPLRDIVAEVQSHGCAAMIQLTHLGRRTWPDMADWLPAISASSVREAAHRTYAKVMETWDFERVVSDFAAAAERMAVAGFDGIELECSGHLLGAFLSPATNERMDEFGGTVENRTRFLLLVLREIHRKVAGRLLIGCRLVCDEDWSKGLSKAEGAEIVRQLSASGYVDFLNVIRGHMDDNAPTARLMPVAGMASGPHLDFVGEIRSQTHLPVFHAGKIADLSTARHAIAAGKVDMVGMTRAHIADPHIVNKLLAGAEDHIRPCVGANYCMDRLSTGQEALCIHNASTAREGSLPHVIQRRTGHPSNVVVVGAGPAGLEAARVSAERGNNVTVLEAQPRAGGQLILATRVGRRAELKGIVDWRLAECRRLSVKFQYDVLASADDVLSLKPDIVVVATGGMPITATVEKGEQLLTSSWDIISGQVKPGRRVLLFDDHGGHQGLAVAEILCDAGCELEIVTPERNFAPSVSGINLAQYMRKFVERKARITTMTRVATVRRQDGGLVVELISPMAEASVGERLVDQVVSEAGTAAEAELYFSLLPHSSNNGVIDYQKLVAGDLGIGSNASSSMRVFRIGDAVASRDVHSVIYEADRLCRNF